MFPSSDGVASTLSPEGFARLVTVSDRTFARSETVCPNPRPRALPVDLFYRADR